MCANSGVGEDIILIHKGRAQDILFVRGGTHDKDPAHVLHVSRESVHESADFHSCKCLA